MRSNTRQCAAPAGAAGETGWRGGQPRESYSSIRPAHDQSGGAMIRALATHTAAGVELTFPWVAGVTPRLANSSGGGA